VGAQDSIRSTNQLHSNRAGAGSRQPAARLYHASARFDALASRVHYDRSASAEGATAMTITKFDSLFAGHVDMENVGYGGIPVNERRLPDEHLTTVFDKAEAMAKLMDRLGYS